jgi:hypothetical protein
MPHKKDRRTPPCIFDNKCIAELARTAGLPSAANVPRFKAGIRKAALIYLREAGTPTDNEVYHEVDLLLRAADRAVSARKRKDAACEKVAVQIERLSERTRKLLSKRGTLPYAGTLRDPKMQHDACVTVARLCRMGARWKEGRRRHGGKRSMTKVSVLHAPALQQHPARHEAQLNFAMWVQVAYCEATGMLPTFTAHPDTALRPLSGFPKMLQICLNKLGAGANAVELLNELHRRRKQMRDRLSHQNP